MNVAEGCTVGAIVLAGGRAARVGGAAKPLFVVGGRTLLAAAIGAVRQVGADPVVVAGPVLDPTLLATWVQEDPPFGGPVAGVVAALGAMERPDPDWILVLSSDLPLVEDAVASLTADLPLLGPDADGLCLADASSRPQWLIGIYRTAALRRAASRIPDRGRNAPMRALVADLAITVVPHAAAVDIDTWQDLKTFTEGADDG